MDYKYIEQLLDRYWACQTTLEEEAILRSFFAQQDVPESLAQYKPLFTYIAEEPKADTLGDEFDEKVLAKIEKQTAVKAKVISLQTRLMPLFKAAAVVAIFLSLGNALQMAFEPQQEQPAQGMAAIEQPKNGPAIAKADSTKMDTLKAQAIITPIIK